MTKKEWESINSHQLLLLNFRNNLSQMRKLDSNFLVDLITLQHIWFLDNNGRSNFEERYEITKFDEIEFYKMFSELIIRNITDKSILRELRLSKLMGSDINSEKIKEIIKWI